MYLKNQYTNFGTHQKNQGLWNSGDPIAMQVQYHRQASSFATRTFAVAVSEVPEFVFRL